LDGLQRQLENAEKNLDDANRKFAAARLGESLERNQQSERLQVIEQPALPQKPIKPNRLKLLAFALALSGMAGLCTVFTAETFDRSIRGVRELAGVIDSHLIVAIPYISTKAETLQKKRRLIIVLACLAAILLAGFSAALYLGIAFDLTSAWLDGSWIDRLSRLSK
jgi:capsular polysaccharide biosynthesis protein